MKRLNGISAERAADSLEFTLELLGDPPPAPLENQPELQADFDQSQGELQLDAALLSYALEAQPEQVRGFFQSAAKSLASALLLRGRADNDTPRNPWQAEQFINVVVCFGDRDARMQLAGLAPYQYRNPVRPEHEWISRYLAALLGSFSTKGIDGAVFREIAQACASTRANRDDHRMVGPAARGLAAVADKDEEDWNLAIAELLTVHGRTARSGDWKLLALGFCSLRAMQLAKIGLEHGFQLKAKSDYLPVEFL